MVMKGEDNSTVVINIAQLQILLEENRDTIGHHLEPPLIAYRDMNWRYNRAHIVEMIKNIYR